MNVRKAIHWVPAIQEGSMSQLAGELVKSGQPHNLMSIPTLILEITITAGIPMAILKVSTVTPLTQISAGSTALFHDVMPHTTVRKAIPWVPAIQEG